MQDGLFGAAEHLRRISQPKPASGHVGYDSPSNIVGDMNSPRRLRHDLPGLEESLASPPPHGVGADTELAGRQRDIHPAGIIGVDRRRDLRGRNPQSESQSCHPSWGECVPWPVRRRLPFKMKAICSLVYCGARRRTKSRTSLPAAR